MLLKSLLHLCWQYGVDAFELRWFDLQVFFGNSLFLVVLQNVCIGFGLRTVSETHINPVEIFHLLVLGVHAAEHLLDVDIARQGVQILMLCQLLLKRALVLGVNKLYELQIFDGVLVTLDFPIINLVSVKEPNGPVVVLRKLAPHF